MVALGIEEKLVTGRTGVSNIMGEIELEIANAAA